MKRDSIPKSRPKSPESDDISFSMSDISHSSNSIKTKPEKMNASYKPAAKGGVKKASVESSFELSGSDFSVDFSELSQTKAKVPPRVKDNSAAAIMGKKINSASGKPKKALTGSDSFSISGDDIVFSDEETTAPPARSRAPATKAINRRVEQKRASNSLSFSISGDDIVFSDDGLSAAAAKVKSTPQSKLAAKSVSVKPQVPPKFDPRASLDSDDIQFSGDSDSETGPIQCAKSSGSNRRVAESNLKLNAQGKANNRYQDEGSVTPSHTPSLGGSSFASEQDGSISKGQYDESKDDDNDSYDGKPNIMMGDDLADLMSSAGLVKPASQSKADEDDPLSGMNCVVQKFSDDEDDEPEEDDESESFDRRYYEDARSESKDDDNDSDDGKPSIMMGDDLADLISSAGLVKPASQSKADEDDPLSGMNCVVQKFSDDEDDEPEEDDKSESFDRRYYEDARSESKDDDNDSDDGKPNIMMGDDLADLMSSAGLVKPASQSKADEDDPLSGMNCVVQKFSDDEDDEPEEDDESESFDRRFYEDARSESKDDDKDSNDGKPNMMMGDDLADLMSSVCLAAPTPLPPPITSEVSISRSLALAAVNASPKQPVLDMSVSANDLIHPVATSWAFTPSPQPLVSPPSLFPSATIQSSLTQQAAFIPHPSTSQPMVLQTVKVYLKSSETQTTTNQELEIHPQKPPNRPIPEIVDLDPTPSYGLSAVKQRTVALQVGSGNEVASQVAFDPREGGSLVEDSLHHHETLHQAKNSHSMHLDETKRLYHQPFQPSHGSLTSPMRIKPYQASSINLTSSHSLISGPMSSWGVLTMAVQSMKAAALMEKVQETTERQRQALETDLLLQDYMNASNVHAQQSQTMNNSGSWPAAPHHSHQPSFTPNLRGQGVSFGHRNPAAHPSTPNANPHGAQAKNLPPTPPLPPGHQRTLSSQMSHPNSIQAPGRGRRNSGSDPGGGSPFPPLSKSSISVRSKQVTNSFSCSIRSMDGSSYYDEDFEEEEADDEEAEGLGGIQEDDEEIEEEIIQSEPSSISMRSKGGSSFMEDDEEINKTASAAAAKINRARTGSRTLSLADAYSEAFEDDAQSEAYTNDFASPFSSFTSPQQFGSNNMLRGSKISSVPQAFNGSASRVSISGGGIIEASPSASSLHRQSASFGGSRAGSISVRRSTTFGGADIPETNKLESLEAPLKSKPPPASKPQSRSFSAHKRTDSTIGRGEVPQPRPAWYDSPDVYVNGPANLLAPQPPALTPAQVTILRYHNLITSGALDSSGQATMGQGMGQGLPLPFFNSASIEGNLVNNLAPSPSLAAASGLHFRAPIAPTTEQARSQFLTGDNQPSLFISHGASSLMSARQDLLQTASLAARGVKASDLVGERSADNDFRLGVDRLRAKLNRIQGFGGGGLHPGLRSAGESLNQRAVQDLKEKLSGASSSYLGVGSASVRMERMVELQNGRLVDPHRSSYQYTTLSDTLKLIERLRK